MCCFSFLDEKQDRGLPGVDRPVEGRRLPVSVQREDEDVEPSFRQQLQGHVRRLGPGGLRQARQESPGLSVLRHQGTEEQITGGLTTFHQRRVAALHRGSIHSYHPASQFISRLY